MDDVLSVDGEYDLLSPEDEQVFAYTRTLGDERILIVLNWSKAPASVDLGPANDRPDPTDPSVCLSNYDDTSIDLEARPFRPYEAAVYRC
jgi:oligo-1,6-glucosidase